MSPKCETCGAPVTLVPDGDPRYESRDNQLKNCVKDLRLKLEEVRKELAESQVTVSLLQDIINIYGGKVARDALAGKEMSDGC